MSNLFTYKVVIQVTQEIDSLDAAEIVALDFTERLSEKMADFNMGSTTTAIHLFVLSIKDEGGFDDSKQILSDQD